MFYSPLSLLAKKNIFKKFVHRLQSLKMIFENSTKLKMTDLNATVRKRAEIVKHSRKEFMTTCRTDVRLHWKIIAKGNKT